MTRRVSMVMGIILGWLVLCSIVVYCSDEKTPPPAPIPSESVELLEQRTEYSRTFLNPDGSRTLEISSSPLYYRNEHGILAEVGPAIVAVPDGKAVKYQVEKALYQCSFGTSEEGYTFVYNDYELCMQPLQVESGIEPENNELAVFYTRPWSNADLVYEVGSAQVKERMILYNRSAANEYQFKLTLPENSTILKEEQGLKIRLANEESYFFIPNPFVADQMGEEISYADVSLQYSLLTENELLLVYEIEESWLQSAERVFPVILDPTLELRNDVTCWGTFPADQIITIDIDMYMPAMNIPYDMDHFYFFEGEKELIHEWLYGIPVFPRELKKSISHPVKKDKTYKIVTRNGAGKVPILRTVEGRCLVKIRYYEIPVVEITTTNTISKTPPQLSWRVPDDVQTNYVIVLAKNQNALSSLLAPVDLYMLPFTPTDYILKYGSTGVMSFTPPINSLKEYALNHKTTEEGTWYYKIAVYNGGVWSDWSALASFKLDSSVPDFTGPLALAPGNQPTTLHVSWTAASDQNNPLDPAAGSSTSDLRYRVVCDKTNVQISGTSYDITGLNLNQIYQVQVTAIDEAGNNKTLTESYNTPPEQTEISRIEFEKDGEGGYRPVVYYYYKWAYAYMVNMQELVYTPEWVRTAGERNILAMQKVNVSLESGKAYTYQVRTANQSGFENKSTAGASIVNSTAYSVVTPNEAPSKPTILEPTDKDCVIPEENTGGEEGYQTVVKATAANDYEGDALCYNFILYEDLGEEAATNLPLSQDDPEFIAYCEEQFTAAYELELDQKIRAEYSTATVETLESWLNLNSLKQDAGSNAKEESTVSEAMNNSEIGASEEPASALHNGQVGVDERNDSPHISSTSEETGSGTQSIVDTVSTNESASQTVEMNNDIGETTSKSMEEEKPVAEPDQSEVKNTAEPTGDDKPEPASVYISDVYSYEEYHALVYDIQYSYYRQEFLDQFKKEAFAVYSEENNPRYTELWRSQDIYPDANGSLSATLQNLQENVNYALRVEAREVDSGLATLSEPHHFVVDLSGPTEPTFTLAKWSWFWKISPNYIYNATDTPDLVLTKIKYDVEDTVRLSFQIDSNPEMNLPLSTEDLSFKLPPVEGVYTVRLTAYDSANNSTTTERQIILDQHKPYFLNNALQTISGEHSVTVKWQPAVDYPKINGYNNIRYYEVWRKWSLTSTKVFPGEQLQLTKSTGDYNQEISFTIKAVDQAGNVSDGATISGYSYAQTTTIADIEQINGVGTHKLRVKLNPVVSGTYGLVYGQMVNGVVGETVTLGPSANPLFELNVHPHGEYRFWAKTYNNAGQSLALAQLVPVDFTVANNRPTAPTASPVPAYVRTFPLTLNYTASYDPDHCPETPEPVEYFNRIESGTQAYIDPVVQGRTAETFFVVESLPEGQIYSWQVGASDGKEPETNGVPVIVYNEPQSFVVDTIKPSITISPEPTNCYQVLDKVKVTAFDAVSGVAVLTYQWQDPTTGVTLESGTIASGDEISTMQGEHKLLVTATDAAGNSASAYCVYKIDWTEPVIQNLSIEATPYAGRYIAESSTIAFSLECTEDVSKITYLRYGFIEEDVSPDAIDHSALLVEPILPEQLKPIKEGGYQLAETFYNSAYLDPAKKYYLFVQAVNEVDKSATSFTDSTVQVDLTMPEFTSAMITGFLSGPGGLYLRNPADLVPNFSASDPESGVLPLRYGILRANELISGYKQSVPELQTVLADFGLVQDGETLQVVVLAENNLLKGTQHYSEPFVIDRTAPSLAYLRVGLNPLATTCTQSKNTGIDVSWKMTDATGIAEYAYCIGRTQGGNDVSLLNPAADDDGWVTLASIALEQQMEISSGVLPFADGTYYIRIRGVDFAGNERIAAANPLTIDSSLEPEVSVETNPYLTRLDALGMRVIYPGSREITGYRFSLFAEGIAGELNLLQSGEIVTFAKDYSCSINYDFTQGQHYYLEVHAEFADGSGDAVGWSPRILVDATAPVIDSLSVPAYSQSSGVQISWIATDPDYGLTASEQGLSYEVKLGTTYGGNELVDWTDSALTHYTFTGVSLTDYVKVYTTLKVTNAAGLSSEMKSGPVMIDDSAPVKPVVKHLYGRYTANSDYLDFSWETTGIETAFLDHYEVAISTLGIIPATAEWVNVGTATSYHYEAPLVNGTKYYLAVRAYAKNGRYSESLSEGVTIDFTKPDLLSVIDAGGFSSNTTSISAELMVYEDVSEIAYINYAVGTAEDPEAVQTYQRIPFDPDDLQITVNGALAYGEIYYFYVNVENSVLLVSDQMTSDGIRIVKANAPKVSSVQPVSEHSATNTALNFTWNLDDTTAPYKFFRYALVTNTAEIPEVWEETVEKQCILLPDGDGTAGLAVFADGTYYLKVECINKLNEATGIAVSSQLIVDTSKPSGLSVQTLPYTGANYSFTLTCTTPGVSGVAEYQYALGSYVGGRDLLDWQSTPTTLTNSAIALPLNLATGQKFYLTARVKNGAGVWSEEVTSGEIVFDTTAPAVPEVTAPQYSTSWTGLKGVGMSSSDTETAIDYYRWQMVQAALKDTLVNLTTEAIQVNPALQEWTLENQFLTYALTADGTYYLGVQVRDQTGNWSAIGYSNAIIIDKTKPGFELTSAGSELVTNSATADVSWITDEPGQINYRLYRIVAGQQDSLIHQNSVSVGTELSGTISLTCTSEGSYRLDAEQEDLYGNLCTTKSRQIRHNYQPVVQYAAQVGSLYKGQTLSVTANASDVEDETIQSFGWKLVKNGAAPVVIEDVAGTANYSKAITEIGSYTLTVTVQDSEEGTGTAVMGFNVTNTKSGSLLLDEEWSGTFLVTGDVTVPAGCTLTIAPGAEISFVNDAGLYVFGKLNAGGTGTEPIVFKGQSIFAGAWEGVKLTQSASSDGIAYVTLRDAKRGLTLVEQDLTLNNMLFTQNQVGLHVVGGSPVINASVFAANEHYGVKEDNGAAPSLTGCGFAMNGRADYYDEVRTWLGWEELNTLPGNSGNYLYEGGVNP